MEGMRENKKEKKTLKVTEYPALKKKKKGVLSHDSIYIRFWKIPTVNYSDRKQVSYFLGLESGNDDCLGLVTEEWAQGNRKWFAS